VNITDWTGHFPVHVDAGFISRIQFRGVIRNILGLGLVFPAQHFVLPIALFILRLSVWEKCFDFGSYCYHSYFSYIRRRDVALCERCGKEQFVKCIILVCR
jgi:hypothetical protein